MKAAQLQVEAVSWAPRRGQDLVVHPTSFTAEPGRVAGIVGPNGAGKSTLLRMLYRFNAPLSGRVLVDGADIWAMPPREAACKIAAVLQEQPTDFALTVREIAALGRVPHRQGFASAGAREAEIVDSALHCLGLEAMGGRAFGTLSGGERQRVMVARALVQEPQVLILDEPTNHLDIRHQLEVLELIRQLDLTVVTSLHDLNLAAGVCDDILLLDHGHPLAFGPPEDVLSEARVSEAFGVEARADHLQHADTRHFTFHLTNQRRP